MIRKKCNLAISKRLHNDKSQVLLPGIQEPNGSSVIGTGVGRSSCFIRENIFPIVKSLYTHVSFHRRTELFLFSSGYGHSMPSYLPRQFQGTYDDSLLFLSFSLSFIRLFVRFAAGPTVALFRQRGKSL